MSLADLLEFFSTNSLSWEQLEYNGDEMYNLHYGLIHVGLPTLINSEIHKLPNIKTGFRPRNFECVKVGDVAFADASEDTNEVAKVVEFIGISSRPTICGLHTIHGRDKKAMTVPGFKGYYFSSTAFHNQIKRLAQGTKIFSVSTKILGECHVSIPSKCEQERISKLMSLLDERIATQRKIIEDLKMLKSAFIDSHFKGTKNGVKLGSLISEVSLRNKEERNIKVLSVSNRLGFIAQSEQFGDRTIASEDTSNYKIVKINDFAYNPARINVGSIARLINFDEGIVSPMYLCFRCNERLQPEYLEQFFESKAFQTEVDKRLEGSVRLCLSFDGLKSIALAVPPLEEQKEFATRLVLIQSYVKLETRLLELYQQQRQSLFTQMFI